MTMIIVIVIIVCLSVAGYSIYLYQEIEESKQADFSSSIQRVLSETEIEQVDEVTRYHGTSYYHAVTGETINGETGIAFVPVNEEAEITYFLMEELNEESSIIDQWRDSCTECSLISTNPALENDHPLWEIKYIDNQDRYVFEYRSMEDGSIYESVRLRQSKY